MIAVLILVSMFGAPLILLAHELYERHQQRKWVLRLDGRRPRVVRR